MKNLFKGITVVKIKTYSKLLIIFFNKNDVVEKSMKSSELFETIKNSNKKKFLVDITGVYWDFDNNYDVIGVNNIEKSNFFRKLNNYIRENNKNITYLCPTYNSLGGNVDSIIGPNSLLYDANNIINVKEDKIIIEKNRSAMFINKRDFTFNELKKFVRKMKLNRINEDI